MKKLIDLNINDFLYIGVLRCFNEYFHFRQRISAVNRKTYPNKSSYKRFKLDNTLYKTEFEQDSYEVSSYCSESYKVEYWDREFNGIRLIYATSEKALLDGIKNYSIERKQELEDMQFKNDNIIKDVIDEIDLKNRWNKLK